MFGCNGWRGAGVYAAKPDLKSASALLIGSCYDTLEQLGKHFFKTLYPKMKILPL